MAVMDWGRGRRDDGVRDVGRGVIRELDWASTLPLVLGRGALWGSLDTLHHILGTALVGLRSRVLGGTEEIDLVEMYKFGYLEEVQIWIEMLEEENIFG